MYQQKRTHQDFSQEVQQPPLINKRHKADGQTKQLPQPRSDPTNKQQQHAHRAEGSPAGPAAEGTASGGAVGSCAAPPAAARQTAGGSTQAGGAPAAVAAAAGAGVGAQKALHAPGQVDAAAVEKALVKIVKKKGGLKPSKVSVQLPPAGERYHPAA